MHELMAHSFSSWSIYAHKMAQHTRDSLVGRTPRYVKANYLTGTPSQLVPAGSASSNFVEHALCLSAWLLTNLGRGLKFRTKQ